MCEQHAEMRRYGLIGHPLGHSFSGGYFGQKFMNLGLSEECSYENFDCASVSQVEEFLTDIKAGYSGNRLDKLGQLSPLSQKDICGLSVTIPYKRVVMGMLDFVDPTAMAVGAVNCIKFDQRGRSYGHNTDVAGFRDSLLEFVGNNDMPEWALILGDGGAAQAVRYALDGIGVRYSVVTRRTAQAELEMNAHLDRCTHYLYSDLNSEIVAAHKLIINTTPLGMWPNVGACPDIPYDGIGGRHLIYDLVYNPAVTEFMNRGAAHGARVDGGQRMLELQADASWEIWNSIV